MLTVGLCGGSGTGKNTAADAFRAVGIPVIDADAVYHEMVDSPSPLTAALAERFGKEILTEGGVLDRSALRRLVFGDGEAVKVARADLNRLTHGEVLKVCRARLREFEADGAACAVVNAPLLLESGFDKECDLVLAIFAERSLRIKRLCARDGLSEAEAADRIDAQLGEGVLTRRADIILENNGTEEELHRRVRSLTEHIQTIAEEKTHGK